MTDAHAYAAKPLTELYTWFAGEAQPTSPTWGALCRWVAATPAVLGRLDTLPGRKRQPNLFLGALKYFDAPLEGGPALLAWLDQHWPEVERLILGRATQTNEPGRCRVLSPVLAGLPQPIALLEVGASAGLCLLTDRLAPEPGLAIVHREGLDANPLDAGDPDDARWLRALVWPGEDEREARLAVALELAAQDPPPVRAGLLPEDLPAALASLRDTAGRLHATPVVMHSATLQYLARPERDEVERIIRDAGVRWVSLEGPTVLTSLKGRVPGDGRPYFVLALDGEPVARCSPHGGWVDWL